ncbi:MAG: pilus assembly protein PilM [Lentisphaerae bacterium]|nr:pilus assembly protein PilM [Lentisphaerota bacterium]MBT4817560.1 pilus assembly protein PilM [Lentisphaerota bacterium]MBT5610136.1 pilus assembly protein PilM [Lentisphaerota bacterium]MBT7057365.1 pilus assembly protein PilM [Lentisphaerota bacterium]MBT7842124.1 pilus assembly protein PilM [Lentisphaerota bacterium]
MKTRTTNKAAHRAGLYVASDRVGAVRVTETAPDVLTLTALGHTELSDVASLESAIREVWQRELSRSATVSCNLGAVRPVVHHAEFPQMDQDELEAAVRLEAEQLIPNVGACVVDHQIITPLGDSSDSSVKTHVLIVAAPTDSVQTRFDTISRCGVELDAIAPDGMALANVVSLLAPEDNASVAVALQIGRTATNFVAVPTRGGSPAPIVRFIAEGANLFASNAAPADGRDGSDDRDLRARRAHWSREVGRSLQFAADRLGGQPAQVRLVGPGSYSDELLQWLAQDIHVPVLQWNPLTEIATADGLDREMVNSQGANLAVALGLALMKEVER